ncbi:MAG: type II toxin-antitoxin system YafQ family toxin [Bacteroidales bacterium]|nr:type II toxin-antitoxin system YafQ family toxin [Bacteroidales bacterium]MBQ8959548.1 type II toxin-antitoxin system YafQ family toxin [Bacteroidales bacterium]
MLSIEASHIYKKGYKRAVKRGMPIERLNEVVLKLACQEALPEKNKDCWLSGKYAGCRECHIQPDWLLIYRIDNGKLVLYLLDTGTHSDLFG